MEHYYTQGCPLGQTPQIYPQESDNIQQAGEPDFHADVVLLLILLLQEYNGFLFAQCNLVFR